MRHTPYFLDGNHLRAARTLAGLSRKALANLTNLHPCSVKDWELKPGPPAGVAVDRMRKALETRGVRVAVATVEGGRVAQLTLEHREGRLAGEGRGAGPF